VRVAGAVVAIAAVALCVWGFGLIGRATTGSMPDSSTKAIVLIGVVVIGLGMFFGFTAARMLGVWRR
jgi:hypothetical protein